MIVIIQILAKKTKSFEESHSADHAVQSVIQPKPTNKIKINC